MFNTPILFLIFARPETTLQVLARIRAIKPSRLYVAADGPRPGIEGDAELCEQTRQLVLKGIDWNCELTTLFRDKNLGCGIAPSSAITWFFEHEEAGIILEDDCLPSMSFFTYAEHCLQKYWDNPQIMHIGGNNFLPSKQGSSSYFYSVYNHIWGWATWRRSWELYNFELEDISSKDFYKTLNLNFPASIRDGWFDLYKSLLAKKLNNPAYIWDFWDYQWTICIWLNKGLCIYPNYNLVSNIGFGPGATHTLDSSNKFSKIPNEEIDTITAPETIKRNKKADIASSAIVFGLRGNTKFFQKLKSTYGKIATFWKGIKSSI